ncbi:CHASE2 domain-containing protein [Alkalinema pantanalense CENA528]|uniref:CHASE2 domain-containing protein n=1 Tax=Alkalinema pantanalense TaxID=1620705 RepID=UPI003D6E0EE4
MFTQMKEKISEFKQRNELVKKGLLIRLQIFQDRLRSGLVNWQTGILPGSVVITIVILLRFWGGLQGLELLILDRMLRHRPAEALDERVLIVGINESDLRQIKTYPVPDSELANLLQQLQKFQPTAIGVDIFRDQPIPPGSQQLHQIFTHQDNVLGIDRLALNPTQDNLVKSSPSLPIDRVGFANAILDQDGSLRRSLLVTESHEGEVRYSLTVLLAERYLEQHGMPLESGIQDSTNIRFGKAEVPRFQGNTGSYTEKISGGVKTLINIRAGRVPFRIISLADVKAQRIKPEWVRNKIVLVGMVAESSKDYVTSHAIESPNPALIHGVVMQAHAVSQLISAAIDNRPLIRSWIDEVEYIWIIMWGGAGIVLGWVVRSPIKLLLSLIGISVALVGIGYGLLMVGWWIPVVPPLLVFLVNGAGLTAFYRYDQELRSRIHERQTVINETFDAIHNGPLQTLSQLQRKSLDQQVSLEIMRVNLQVLDRELRGIYESMRQQVESGENFLYVSQESRINLREPMHEILRQVYEDVLTRDQLPLQSVKFKLVDFQPMNERWLDFGIKRDLCRFLEEAITNVGKHGIGVMKLEVKCGVNNGVNVIRVVDNGAGVWSQHEGMGTQQAKRLAKRLRGEFQRSPNNPQGTICQLSWQPQRHWLSYFGSVN